MNPYWLLFAATLAAIAFCWRREVIRDRKRAREIQRRRHPATRQLTPHELAQATLIVFPTDVAGMEPDELLALVRDRQAAREVAELERMWAR